MVVGGFDRCFDADAIPWTFRRPEGLSPAGRRRATSRPGAGGTREFSTRKGSCPGRPAWGKSSLLVALAADEAIRGRPVGYFSPLFKTAGPVFDALAFMLAPLVVSKNRGR